MIKDLASSLISPLSRLSADDHFDLENSPSTPRHTSLLKLSHDRLGDGGEVRDMKEGVEADAEVWLEGRDDVEGESKARDWMLVLKSASMVALL